MGYLMDTLIGYRRRYETGSAAYAAIDRLIADCRSALSKKHAE